MEPEEPSPLPQTRPADPLKAVEYDTVKAVWAKRRVILSGAVIRTALSEYWIVMKGIRDKWKTEMSLLQQATEKKERAKVVEYERRVTNQRKLLESCIRLTLKHGHPDIVEKYVIPFSHLILSFLLSPSSLFKITSRKGLGQILDLVLWYRTMAPRNDFVLVI